MSDYAVRVENLGKMYRIGGPQEKYQTFRDAITRTALSPFRRARDLIRGQAYGAAGLDEEIWALQDISFDVKHGEVVGIIGHNGAGKSTLLKVLSRITEPSTGFADIYGRVGALLEVGTGFHPELTGRENVYLNGAILGMSRYDIDRKFDEIVDFAGVERFIDTPVKHYSSGMGLRLGFSVAAHLEPEILVIDEVLAVGDAQFQKKCLGKMGDVAAEGRTVLFVSHNMTAVDALCTRAIWLSGGKVTSQGNTQDIIGEYISSTNEHMSIPLMDREDRTGNAAMRFVEIQFRDSDTGNTVVQAGNNIDIVLNYISDRDVPLSNVNFTIKFLDTHNQIILSCTTLAYSGFESLPPNGSVLCQVKNLPLQPGRYTLSLSCSIEKVVADSVINAGYIDVSGGDFFGTGRTLDSRRYGSVLIPHSWATV